MSIAQKETPMSDQQPDMIAQAGDLLKRYQSGLYDPARDTTVVLASAVLAVAAELRDIHNVLHEINQRLHPGPVADGIINPEDAPDPNECRECAGTGLALYVDGEDVIDCPVCHGKGRVWP